MSELVRELTECEPARGTHELEMVEVNTGQDIERMRVAEGHSPTCEARDRDCSRHGKKRAGEGYLLTVEGRCWDRS